MSQIVLDLIDQFEIPKEFHDALFEAYTEGAKRGFIEGSIAVYNNPLPINGLAETD